VATPVWVVRDGDELCAWSVVDSGKVKRIRNNGRVELTACDFGGNPQGPTVNGTARLLDAEGTALLERELAAHAGTYVVATHDPERLTPLATQRLAFA